MFERIGAVSLIIGTVIGLFGLAWFFLRLGSNMLRSPPRKSARTPLTLIVIGALMTSLPIAINSLWIHWIPLGPLNKIVEGERHLTLTGWDQHDYSVIAPYTDTVVLQMANSDVSDDTLKHLSSMRHLRELDLNNTQVTDAGLAPIGDLPELKDLRLARTKITDDGFRKHLMDKDSLLNLDLTGTSVASKTVREWKAAKSDRKVLK